MAPRKSIKNTSVKVAVVQDSPVLFDLEKTIDKTGRLIKEAAAKQAKLILFPEAFISAYPRGLGFGTVVGSRTGKGRENWKLYRESSLELQGKYFDKLCAYVKTAKAYVVLGVIEKDHASSTLYCTMLYFSPAGKLIGKHRKLKPTAAERIIWGEGDGSTLTTIETPFGKTGGLICWENYMPLARMAMYRKGVSIFLAPTADARETWQSTMVHIACEGRCFVLSANQYVTKKMYPEEFLSELKDQPDIMSAGGSVIVSPLGKIIAGPLRNKSGILYAELDMAEAVKGKMDFDVVGHYARNDVFKLEIPDQPETVGA